MRADLVCQQAARRSGYLQAPTTFFEPVEVQIEPSNDTVICRHRLEQAIAVCEPAVCGIDAGGRVSVHEPERVHGATRARLIRSSCSRRKRTRHVGRSQKGQRKRLKATEPLVPPKPNELDSPASSLAWRATFGVKSRSHAGS